MTPKERRLVKEKIETEGLDYFLQEYAHSIVKDQDLLILIEDYQDSLEEIKEYLKKEKIYEM